MHDISGERGFHYDAADLLEPLTKIVKDASGELLRPTNATSEGIEQFLPSSMNSNRFRRDPAYKALKEIRFAHL